MEEMRHFGMSAAFAVEELHADYKEDTGEEEAHR